MTRIWTANHKIDYAARSVSHFGAEAPVLLVEQVSISLRDAEFGPSKAPGKQTQKKACMCRSVIVNYNSNSGDDGGHRDRKDA